MQRTPMIGNLLAFLLVTPTLVYGQAVERQNDSIRTMSFNIRLGVAKDGDNHWEKRKETVLMH